MSKDGFVVPPIPIGHPEQKRIIMTCSEGLWEGGLEWGGKFPNNNWATAWTNSDATITWEADVVRAGKYRVTLEYICPEKDLGSSIRVTAASQQVDTIIDTAIEPNVVYSPDRVPRRSVYERIWGYKRMGVLNLPEGRTQFKVMALTKPGYTVMDLKSVQVEYQD